MRSSAFAYPWRSALIACVFAACLPRPAAAQAPAAPKPEAGAAGNPAPDASAAAAASQDALAAQQRYQFQPGVSCPFCAITPQFPTAESGLHWHHHWKTVGIPEYVITGVAAAAALSVELLLKPENSADWNTPILFDSAARDALRIGSESGRNTAKNLSDALFVVSIVHPLVDDFVFAWWLRESPQVAWQMFVINAQAYAFTLAANVVTKRLTGRARPWAQDCAERPLDERCASGSGYRSFYSGHAAVTATGAGLICAHHTQLSLYRNDYLDTGACITAVFGTALTGALRIASDNHWASDVIIGHLMGYFAGYLYPTLMYYREFRITPEAPGEHAPPPAQPTFTFLPVLSPNALQLSMLGAF